MQVKLSDIVFPAGLILIGVVSIIFAIICFFFWGHF